MNKKVCIYLDDCRIPLQDSWILVKSYDEFVSKVTEVGLENIEIISFDHDLGIGAMREYHTNVVNYKLIDYSKLEDEKTGYHCAHWLINLYLDKFGRNSIVPRTEFIFPTCYVHSANVVGSYNIIGLIENFYNLEAQFDLKVKRWVVPYRISSF